MLCILMGILPTAPTKGAPQLLEIGGRGFDSQRSQKKLVNRVRHVVSTGQGYTEYVQSGQYVQYNSVSAAVGVLMLGCVLF
jgi:hypothetical protein